MTEITQSHRHRNVEVNLRPGYYRADDWSSKWTAQQAKDQHWYQWWHDNGFIAREVTADRITGDLAAMAQALGLERLDEVIILIDPQRAFVVGTTLVFPLDAVCGHLGGS